MNLQSIKIYKGSYFYGKLYFFMLLTFLMTLSTFCFSQSSIKVEKTDKSITFTGGTFIFVNAQNDTINGNEFVKLANSGLYETSVEFVNDSVLVNKSDSIKLLKIKGMCIKKNLSLLEDNKLDYYKNKPFVLDFFSATCKVCMQEIQNLNGLYEQNKNVNYIAITPDSSSKINNWLKENVFKFKIIANTSRINIKKLFAVDVFPTHFLVDKNFVVKDIYVGRLSLDELGSLINGF